MTGYIDVDDDDEAYSMRRWIAQEGVEDVKLEPVVPEYTVVVEPTPDTGRLGAYRAGFEDGVIAAKRGLV